MTSPPTFVWAHEAERRLADIPARWRGWEWRYLVDRLDGSLGTLWGIGRAARKSPEATDAALRTTITDYLGRLGLSPDGRSVSRATTQGVHRWNLEIQRFSGAWPGYGLVYGLADDGSLVLSRDRRQSTPWRIINTESGATRAALREQSDLEFRLARFAPNGKYLATTAVDNSIAVWSVDSGDRIAVVKLLTTPSFIAFGAMLEHLIIGVNSGLYVWPFRARSSPQLLNIPSGTKIIDGAVSDAGRDAVSLDASGAVRWWELSSGESATAVEEHKGATAIALAPEGRFAATGGPMGLSVYGTAPKARFGARPWQFSIRMIRPASMQFGSPTTGEDLSLPQTEAFCESGTSGGLDWHSVFRQPVG